MSTACACADPGAPADLFETRRLGCDETGGRFAEVEIWRCRACGQDWLRYAVEYEAFPRSGRWARGRIGGSDADSMTAERAAGYITGLDSYIRGGSYFGGKAGLASGPMAWD